MNGRAGVHVDVKSSKAGGSSLSNIQFDTNLPAVLRGRKDVKLRSAPNQNPFQLPVLKLNSELRMVIPLVLSWSLFASNFDLLCLKMKPFSLHKTARANSHIEQDDTFFFARNSIDVTCDQRAAMFTKAFHLFGSRRQGTCHN
jgi:hypothetical protein